MSCSKKCSTQNIVSQKKRTEMMKLLPYHCTGVLTITGTCAVGPLQGHFSIHWGETVTCARKMVRNFQCVSGSIFMVIISLNEDQSGRINGK